MFMISVITKVLTARMWHVKM